MYNATASRKETFRHYSFVPEINPKFVQYQRIQGRVNGGMISFKAMRPLPNSILSAKAYIKWTVTVERNQDDGAGAIAPANFPTEIDETALYRKPFMVMANSTASARVLLNGYGLDYQRPTDWYKYLAQMFLTESQLKKNFSTCGAPFPDYLGSYDDQFLVVNISGESEPNADDNIQFGLNQAFRDYDVARNASSLATFTYLEPVGYGPFNPFYDIKKDLPASSWFSQMSDTIPYVHQLELEITLEKIAANNFMFPYSLGVLAETTVLLDRPELTTGELVLQWICPRTPPAIPPMISLPSWQVDARSFKVFGDPNDADRVADDTTAQFNGDIIHYHTVPDYIMIFATHDKTADEYFCRARVTDTDGAGAGQNAADGEEGSQENNMSFDAFQLTVDVNNTLVNTLWNEQELYNVTAKNCHEIPFGFGGWQGGSMQFAQIPGNAFVLFRPDDINIKWSDGSLRHDFTLQLTATLRARTGHSFQDEAFVEDSSYRLHIVLLYKNYFIDIGKDGKVSSRLLHFFV